MYPEDNGQWTNYFTLIKSGNNPFVNIPLQASCDNKQEEKKKSI